MFKFGFTRSKGRKLIYFQRYTYGFDLTINFIPGYCCFYIYKNY